MTSTLILVPVEETKREFMVKKEEEGDKGGISRE
jgi:hypothetical protein